MSPFSSNCVSLFCFPLSKDYSIPKEIYRATKGCAEWSTKADNVVSNCFCSDLNTLWREGKLSQSVFKLSAENADVNTTGKYLVRLQDSVNHGFLPEGTADTLACESCHKASIEGT